MGIESFAAFLLEKRKITSAALDRAAKLRDETGQPLSTVLTNLGLISELDIASGYADYLSIPRLLPKDFPDDPFDAPDLSPAWLRRVKALPIETRDDYILVTMANPLDDFTQKALEFALQKPVRSAVSAVTEIEHAIEQLYFSFSDEEEGAAFAQSAIFTDDVERLKELASDAPVIKFVNRMITQATEQEASDIHFEPMEDRFRVRFRKDGLLQDVEWPPVHMQAAIISRLKIMAGLNIAERRLSQDGRFKTTVRGREIDLRVSATPTAYGESVVLRILNRSELPGDFASLGFDENTVTPFRRALEKPDGIILVTGPTGSGKTTTLYVALQQLNVPEKKILTIEDPIEYMLDGINQVQVDPKIGRSFAATLRSFLRQDPDIMMVGEIRDGETARIAIQASLTGHLVLSTLHTNDAASALTRLIDMGVEDYLIASTITVIVAQRLVRKLCTHCREPYEADSETLRRQGIGIEDGTRTFYQAKGCEACHSTGYRGRTGIIEILEMTDEIRSLLNKKTDAGRIEAMALKQGMTTMFEDGIKKVQKGVTTLEEVIRVTREN